MPIPAQLIPILAAPIVEKIADAMSKPKGRKPTAKEIQTVTDTIASTVKDAAETVLAYDGHNLAQQKAKVRPQVMRRMGNLTALQTVIVAGIGVAYAFGWGIEDWERAVGAALIVGGGAGVSGGAYLWGHTARSVEKVKGAA